MRNQNGISLITLIIIIAIVIGAIVFFIVNSQGSTSAKIEWGSKPSNEYFELLSIVFDSKLLKSEEGTLSLSSFNALGEDVKKAGGKWFDSSIYDFWAQTLYKDNYEIVTLTNGWQIAIFMYKDGIDYVTYYFMSKEELMKNGYDIIDFIGCKVIIE